MGKAISGMGLKAPVFPPVTSILFGSKGDRPACLSECLLCFTEYRCAQCITRPLTVHSKLAELYVPNVTINLAMLLCVPVPFSF